MKLRSASGNSIELVVLRYEFPDLTEDRWESNWLVINGTVAAGEHRWRFTHPSVTTFELADLADWLDGIARGEGVPPEFAFTEPNLKFVCASTPERALRVTFAQESAPPTGDGTVSSITLDFPFSDIDPADVASQVRDVLIDFPIRGGAA